MPPCRGRRESRGWRHTRSRDWPRRVCTESIRVNIARSLTLSAERKQAQEAAAAAAAPAKRAPEDTLAERPGKSAKPSAAAGGQVPDEYLPPNKTLFLRDLPEDYGKDMLAIIFKRYPGFREIRLVPGRNTIAFAEYEDETGATAAKEALANLELSSQKIKITYQRQ
jgi:U2 small nuclear ribonucleoprotein B''